jgi:hypothetical protein
VGHGLDDVEAEAEKQKQKQRAQGQNGPQHAASRPEPDHNELAQGDDTEAEPCLEVQDAAITPRYPDLDVAIALFLPLQDELRVLVAEVAERMGRVVDASAM